MKPKQCRHLFFCLTVLTALLLGAAARGQNAVGNGSSPNDYQIVSRGPSWRVWQRALISTNDAGIAHTNFQSYNELCDGLCVWNGSSWTDSSPQINLVPDGAQTAGTQFSLHWSANVNADTPNGALTYTAPGGQVYGMKVFGLVYWDSATDTNLLVAQLQDSQGFLVGSNEVAYQNVLTGNGGTATILADLVYDYSVSGYDQNLLIRSQLPAPHTLGLNDASTYVQLWTEFVTAAGAAPSPTSWLQEDGVTNDAFLSFAGFDIGIGQAFLSTNDAGSVSAGVVGKQWMSVASVAIRSLR